MNVYVFITLKLYTWYLCFHCFVNDFAMCLVGNMWGYNKWTILEVGRFEEQDLALWIPCAKLIDCTKWYLINGAGIWLLFGIYHPFNAVVPLRNCCGLSDLTRNCAAADDDDYSSDFSLNVKLLPQTWARLNYWFFNFRWLIYVCCEP